MVIDMEAEEAKKSVLRLMEQRNQIDNELKELKNILDKNRVGMTESLVDAEGYPRADIDVYQVRHARHKIICLQNDYKVLMKKIEAGLSEIHSIGKASSSRTESPQLTTVTTPVSNSANDESIHNEPFLRINHVSEGSPAEQAGLAVNDLVTEFGSINFHNYKSLQDIGNLVTNCRYKTINVRVKRINNDWFVLKLIPKPWEGKGLLGCEIVPLETVER